MLNGKEMEKDHNLAQYGCDDAITDIKFQLISRFIRFYYYQRKYRSIQLKTKAVQKRHKIFSLS